MTVKTKYTPFINKKVQIALIESKGNALYKDREQATLLAGASKDFGVPTDRYGNLVDPLTEEERIYLEELLGINLSVHIKNNRMTGIVNFWTTKMAKVKLTKVARNVSSATITLDLTKPYELIHYRIAQINPRVAQTWGERYERKDYEFVIKDGEVEFEEQLDNLEISDTVIGYLLNNKKSKKKLFDLLRMYGGKTSKLINYGSSVDMMYAELRKIGDIKLEMLKLHKIITLGEADIALRVLLADAVTSGLVVKSGLEYKLVGGERMGFNTEEAISYLTNTKHQSTKIRIEQAIEEYYKKN